MACGHTGHQNGRGNRIMGTGSNFKNTFPRALRMGVFKRGIYLPCMQTWTNTTAGTINLHFQKTKNTFQETLKTRHTSTKQDTISSSKHLSVQPRHTAHSKGGCATYLGNTRSPPNFPLCSELEPNSNHTSNSFSGPSKKPTSSAENRLRLLLIVTS